MKSLACQFAVDAYCNQLVTSDEARPVREWLHESGVADATSEKYRLGYAPEGGDWLVRQGGSRPSAAQFIHDDLSVAENGEALDRFRGQLLLPLHANGGYVDGFAAWSMDTDSVTSITRRSLRFKPECAMFGLPLAKEAAMASRTMLVVQSPILAMKAHQEGFINIVATLGHIRVEQIERLLRLVNRVIVCDREPCQVLRSYGVEFDRNCLGESEVRQHGALPRQAGPVVLAPQLAG